MVPRLLDVWDSLRQTWLGPKAYSAVMNHHGDRFPGCVTRPRRSPPEARWISGAQGGGLTQRRAAVIRQVFDEVLLIRALLNERRRSESNRRIEVLQTSALPLGYGAGLYRA